MAGPDRESMSGIPSTNWSNVRKAAADAGPGPRPALDELLRRYRKVLWAHLVYQKSIPTDQADDLVHDFIQRKILEGSLLQLADPGKGKFRTFLLTALDRFVIDCWRNDARTPPPEELRADLAAAPGPDRDDVIWAMHVVSEGLRRMRAECASKRRPDLWGVFAGRAVTPLSYELLAERLGLDSAKQAANRYPIALAMFHRNFRAVLAEDGGEDVEEQARDFQRLLSETSTELIEQMRIDLWSNVPEVTTSSDMRIDRSALCRLLELPRHLADPATLLRHVLTAPLPVDLAALDAMLAEKARAWAEGQGLVLKSFADVLYHPHPLPDLLELAKDFAKEHRTDPESPLPREVATVLYYAFIAVALTRCGQRITRNEDGPLREGFRWGCEQPWVDEATRELLRGGLRALGGAE